MPARGGVVVVLAAAWLASFGCGDDGGRSGGEDAGAADAGTPTGDVPWLADGVPPVAPPSMGPCPKGWREVVDATGVTTCDPWPESGPEDCSGDEAHFPGEPGCARLGSACPTAPDEYATDLPAGGTIFFVRAGAIGGDGSRALPYGSISSAIAGAGSDAIIAIAPGEYDEILRLPSGVTLWGACVAGTRLTSSVAADTAVV